MYKDIGSRGVKHYWKCVEDNCDSKFHSVNGEIVKWVNTSHTHLPIHGKVAAEEALAEARVRATTTAESKIPDTETFNTSVQAALNIMRRR